MPRYALLLSYRGTAFHGWWRQPGRRTVAGTLDMALARLGEPQAHPVGAARTDAGVHARGQVAHADLVREWPGTTLLRALNSQLPDDLRCWGVLPCPSDFHAVHDAVGKTYRYHLDCSPWGDPLLTDTAWRPPRRPDPMILAAQAQQSVGTWDLQAFRRNSDHRRDCRVHIVNVTWDTSCHPWVCSITADRFLYRLARSLTGCMVQEAGGMIPSGSLLRMLAGGPGIAPAAPAKGLHLHEVMYQHGFMKDFDAC